MGPELVARVNWITLILLVPVTLASAWIGGASSALGTVAGGLLSLGSLYWVSRGVRNAGGFLAGGRSHKLWIIALGLRYAPSSLCCFVREPPTRWGSWPACRSCRPS